MRIPRVASRYAKALLDLAIERNEIDAVKADAEVVIKALKESHDLRVFFSSPIIKPLVKENLVAEIFGKAVGEMAIKFMTLVIRHRREQNIGEILERYVALYLIERGIVVANITTSVELDDALRTEFSDMVKGLTNKEVELNEKVDAEIIGGYIVRVGDNEYDASISGKLKRLKTELKDNPYAAEL